MGSDYDRRCLYPWDNGWGICAKYQAGTRARILDPVIVLVVDYMPCMHPCCSSFESNSRRKFNPWHRRKYAAVLNVSDPPLPSDTLPEVCDLVKDGEGLVPIVPLASSVGVPNNVWQKLIGWVERKRTQKPPTLTIINFSNNTSLASLTNPYTIPRNWFMLNRILVYKT